MCSSDLRGTFAWIPIAHYVKQHTPYQFGDSVYVRETWQEVFNPEYGSPKGVTSGDAPIEQYITNFGEIDKTEQPKFKSERRKAYWVYRASDIQYADTDNPLNWVPSTQMPRSACRLWGTVESIRPEQTGGVWYWVYEIVRAGRPEGWE